MSKSAFQRSRRRAYVRRERRKLMGGCGLIGAPLFLGGFAFVLTFIVFGVLNLLLPYFVWLPPEKRVSATFGEFMEIVGFCTALTVGMYYVGWVFFFILAPDTRDLPKPDGHNHRLQ